MNSVGFRSQSESSPNGVPGGLAWFALPAMLLSLGTNQGLTGDWTWVRP